MPSPCSRISAAALTALGSGVAPPYPQWQKQRGVSSEEEEGGRRAAMWALPHGKPGEGPKRPQRRRSPGEGAESGAGSLPSPSPPLCPYKRGGRPQPGPPDRLVPAGRAALPASLRRGQARPGLACCGRTEAGGLHGLHPQAAAGAGAVLQGEVSVRPSRLGLGAGAGSPCPGSAGSAGGPGGALGRRGAAAVPGLLLLLSSIAPA